jgi:peptide/nickel transport system ATP-binding protein
MIDPVIEVKDICVDYLLENAVRLHALDHVSFSLRQGEALGIVGESGCGKTTLMLSLLRLLPNEGRITGGEIIFGDKDLLQLSEAEMRRIRWNDISLIFQGAMNALNPVRTIESQILEVMVLHNTIPSRKEALQRVKELLDLVGIPFNRARQYPHEYSGGMRQRVMIAMSLACNPRILIADEPTTALDVMVQAQIISLLNDLKQKLGLALILVTHDLGLVGELCDDSLVMYAGMAAEFAPAETIFTKPAHPYTRRLLEAFPNIESSIKKLDSIPGAPPRLDVLPPGCRFAPRCDCKQDLCDCEIPVLTEIEPGHFIACHWPRSQS